MNKRISIRLDDELNELFIRLEGLNLINISKLVREAIKEYLKKYIDNSVECTLLEKGMKNVF